MTAGDAYRRGVVTVRRTGADTARVLRARQVKDMRASEG